MVNPASLFKTKSVPMTTLGGRSPGILEDFTQRKDVQTRTLKASDHISSANLFVSSTLSSAYIVAGGHPTASGAYVVNCCYGTIATPPAAAGTSEGCIYLQYTA